MYTDMSELEMEKETCLGQFDIQMVSMNCTALLWILLFSGIKCLAPIHNLWMCAKHLSSNGNTLVSTRITWLIRRPIRENYWLSSSPNSLWIHQTVCPDPKTWSWSTSGCNSRNVRKGGLETKEFQSVLLWWNVSWLVEQAILKRRTHFYS